MRPLRPLLLCCLAVLACSQGTTPAPGPRAVADPPVREIKTTPVHVGPKLDEPLPAEAQTAQLVDQDGKARTLKDEDGKVRVLSFFFRCCSDVKMCPALTTNLADAAGRLSAEEKADTRVLLVSFDPERDTPEKLKEHAATLRLDTSYAWLLTGAVDEVRKITGACMVWFLKEKGDISHNMVTSVLDKKGVVRAVFRGSEFDAAELLKAIRAARKQSE
jgi:protein SCO1/2